MPPRKAKPTAADAAVGETAPSGTKRRSRSKSPPTPEKKKSRRSNSKSPPPPPSATEIAKTIDVEFDCEGPCAHSTLGCHLCKAVGRRSGFCTDCCDEHDDDKKKKDENGEYLRIGIEARGTKSIARAARAMQASYIQTEDVIASLKFDIEHSTDYMGSASRVIAGVAVSDCKHKPKMDTITNTRVGGRTLTARCVDCSIMIVALRGAKQDSEWYGVDFVKHATAAAPVEYATPAERKAKRHLTDAERLAAYAKMTGIKANKVAEFAIDPDGCLKRNINGHCDDLAEEAEESKDENDDDQHYTLKYFIRVTKGEKDRDDLGLIESTGMSTHWRGLMNAHAEKMLAEELLIEDAECHDSPNETHEPKDDSTCQGIRHSGDDDGVVHRLGMCKYCDKLIYESLKENGSWLEDSSGDFLIAEYKQALREATDGAAAVATAAAPAATTAIAAAAAGVEPLP